MRKMYQENIADRVTTLVVFSTCIPFPVLDIKSLKFSVSCWSMISGLYASLLTLGQLTDAQTIAA